MLKERTQSLVTLSKLVPDTFCWLLLQKKKLTEEANIFIFHTGHQCTFMRYGKQTYLFTNTFVFRPVRYQSILQDDWRIYSSLLVTHTMIENIFFEAYRIRKKLWYRCPWCKSPAVLGEDSWKYFCSECVKRSETGNVKRLQHICNMWREFNNLYFRQVLFWWLVSIYVLGDRQIIGAMVFLWQNPQNGWTK